MFSFWITLENELFRVSAIASFPHKISPFSISMILFCVVILSEKIGFTVFQNFLLSIIDLGHVMYQSLIPTRVCSKYVDSLLLKSCSLQNIKNGDSLLSENRVVFYFRNEMYYLRWRRSSACEARLLKRVLNRKISLFSLTIFNFKFSFLRLKRRL